jgi:hypothetical protein
MTPSVTIKILQNILRYVRIICVAKANDNNKNFSKEKGESQPPGKRPKKWSGPWPLETTISGEGNTKTYEKVKIPKSIDETDK